MKTFKRYLEQPEVIDESLQNIATVGITARITNIKNQISGIKFNEHDSVTDIQRKLFLKLDLIATQNQLLSLAAAGILLTKGPR